MNTQQKINQLKIQLENLFFEMPQSHFELEQRNKSAFLISKQIEKLENPISYNQNKNHWDNHEIRL